MIYDPEGSGWIPHPAGSWDWSLAARVAWDAILVKSGRLPALWKARSQEHENRLVLALFLGRNPLEIEATDRELATETRYHPRTIQKGIRDLCRMGFAVRERIHGRRVIRLVLPTDFCTQEGSKGGES